MPDQSFTSPEHPREHFPLIDAPNRETIDFCTVWNYVAAALTEADLHEPCVLASGLLLSLAFSLNN